MRAWGLLLLWLLLLPPASPQGPGDRRMPNGKSRSLAILKHDYEKSKEDVTEIIRLARELEEEIKKNELFVLDVGSVRKAEKIEKLARDIKKRMKRIQ